MSKIITIRDQLRTAVAALFPSKTRIPNHLSIPDNAIQYVRNGWAVQVGDGAPGVINILKEDSEIRNFNIILTKEVLRLENSVDTLEDVEEDLLEDIRTARNDLLAHDQITIGSTIEKVDFVAATGIELIQTGKFNILTAAITFGIEYTETILDS